MPSSRRDFMKQTASLAAAAAVGASATGGTAAAAATTTAEGGDLPLTGSGAYPDVAWPGEVQEGPDTPKLCQWFSRTPNHATIRRWRQAGVRGALVTNPPAQPWQAATLTADRARIESSGLHITAYLISAPNSVIRATAARDQGIANMNASLVAAGQAGIPVVEYNWYVHRLSEAYYEIIDNEDRLGAGYTGYDYDRLVNGVPARDLPPTAGTPIFTAEQLWANYEYFLERVIPVAEEAGVRLAVHPNDPPAPVSRGNPQVLASVEDWKRLVETVDSPANGMTVHAGVTPEVGGDAVDFLRYMGDKDRINHIHYRNVTVDEPFVRYAEVFPDNGVTDMFAFMRELVRQGYNRGILAEHSRAIDYDREHPGGITGQYANVGGGGHAGELFDTGYARAMMQAALTIERGKPGSPSFSSLRTELNHLVAVGGITSSLERKIRHAFSQADAWLAIPGKETVALSHFERAIRLLLWQADVVERGKPNQGDPAGLRALAASVQRYLDVLRAG